MKIVHLSTSDLAGGAAIACKRIVDAQALNGIDAKLLVQKKISFDPKVISTTTKSLSKLYYQSRMVLDEGFIRFFTNKDRGRFSYPKIGLDISKYQIIKDANVINLQWINGGFISLKAIERIGKHGKPIVWILHDMWSFTGGCHYVGDCNKYLSECKNCPALKFRSNHDLSNRIFKRKESIFNKLNLTFVTTSNWLASEVARSYLFSNKNIFVIPTPIDSSLFKPVNKNSVRKNLKLPLDKKIILFGAMNLKDKRKGFYYLIEALNFIKNKSLNSEIEIAVFGKIDKNILNKIPFKVNQLGSVKNDDQIVSVYNSADVFVAPSLEDNLPNTIMESMACGTPVVAFDTGGIPDMVDNELNGLLTKLRSAEALAEGMLKILLNEDYRQKMSEAARAKVLQYFNPQNIAAKYRELYTNLIQN